MMFKKRIFLISFFLLMIIFCGKTDNVPSERVKIEILNGSNVGGLANELTNYIRSNYFSYYDVRRMGNASETNYTKSILIYRQKQYKLDAQRLASWLGIVDCLYIGNGSNFAALSVILGEDFKIPDTKK